VKEAHAYGTHQSSKSLTNKQRATSLVLTDPTAAPGPANKAANKAWKPMSNYILSRKRWRERESFDVSIAKSKRQEAMRIASLRFYALLKCLIKTL